MKEKIVLKQVFFIPYLVSQEIAHHFSPLWVEPKKIGLNVIGSLVGVWFASQLFCPRETKQNYVPSLSPESHSFIHSFIQPISIC